MTRIVCLKGLSGSDVWIEGQSHTDKKPKRLRFAGQCIDVNTLARPRTSDLRQTGTAHSVETTLRVSPWVRKTLRLPASSHLNVYIQGDEWRLGPCLGLYASSVAKQDRVFGEQTMMFQDMVRLGHEYGVDVVIMTPGCLKTQVGWRYDTVTSNWVQEQLPTPDIVLRRSGTFRKPWMDVNYELKTLDRQGKLHTLPRSISNKWTFYRLLKTVTGLKDHLPVSHLAKSGSDVWNISRTYRDVYVKPLTGAQGISVYRLQMHHSTLLATWEERDVRRTGHKNAKSLSTSVKERKITGEADFLRFWQQTGLRQCIVQETIDLPRTDDGRPFDFRWLIQYTEKPHVVARVARVGKPQSVTTNIHTGGQAVDAGQVLNFIDGKSPHDLTSKLDKVALTVAETLRKKLGPFAEMGVDLAIRPDGRIIVFEVNPTPGRRMLRSLSGTVREMSLEYLLEYAIRATEF
jgi:glutathione synthase/RimK-type ligase-like ATP-grasp enzyme